MTVQLDPVIIGPPDETDEERGMREAREAAASAAQQVGAQPLPLPDQTALPSMAELGGRAAPAPDRPAAALGRPAGRPQFFSPDEYPITEAERAENRRYSDERVREAEGWLADPYAFEGPGARPRAVPASTPSPVPVPARVQPQAPTQPPRPAPAAPPFPRTVDFGEPVAIGAQPTPPEAPPQPGLGRALERTWSPDAEVWGYADDNAPTLPGRVRSQASPAPSRRDQLISLLKARQQRAQSAQQASGPDYTGADWSDALRRPLHAVGNALLAAGGRPGIPFRSDRAALREQSAGEALETQRRAQGEAASRLSDRRLALEEQQIAGAQEAREATAQDRAADRESRERIAQMRSQPQGNELRTVQADQLRQQLARNVAMRDSTSQESQLLRDDFGREMAVMQGLGWRPPPALMQALTSMTGEQLERVRGSEAMQSVYRRYGIRGRGGPGGGVGGGLGASGPSRDALERELTGHDIPLAAVDLSTPRGRERAQRELLQRTRPSNREEVGERTERYGTARRQSGVSEGLAALQGVYRELDRNVPGWRRGNVDIPGIGATGMAPNFMLSRGGRDVSGAMERLLDTQLREATGAAAPPTEVGTFRRILGIGTMSTDQDMIQALRRAEGILQSWDSELVRTFGEDAANEWRSRGASAAQRQPGPSAASAPERARSQPAASGQVRVRIPGRGMTPPMDAERARTLAGRIRGAEVVP